MTDGIQLIAIITITAMAYTLAYTDGPRMMASRCMSHAVTYNGGCVR